MFDATQNVQIANQPVRYYGQINVAVLQAVSRPEDNGFVHHHSPLDSEADRGVCGLLTCGGSKSRLGPRSSCSGPKAGLDNPLPKMPVNPQCKCPEEHLVRL